MSACLEFIALNDCCQDEPEFLDLKLENIQKIIENSAQFKRKDRLFFRVMRWSREECKRQSLDFPQENQLHILGDCLLLFNFCSREFTDMVRSSGLLSDSKLLELMLIKEREKESRARDQLHVNELRVRDHEQHWYDDYGDAHPHEDWDAVWQ